MAKRKISYNYLFLKIGEIEQPIENALTTILNYIVSKEKVNRKQDVNKEKIAFLDNINYDTTNECHTIKILFKNAKHSYRAPLLPDFVTFYSLENSSIENQLFS